MTEKRGGPSAIRKTYGTDQSYSRRSMSRRVKDLRLLPVREV
jgi:hypothetical protein